MILSEEIYEIVRNQLVANGITAYSDSIPAETSYAFCMYEILNLESYPPWAFGKDYERNTVRFSVYDYKDNPSDAVVIAEQIESLFNRIKLTFVDGTAGKYLVCCYKINDSIEIEDNPKRWKVIGDYEFVCQRDI